MEFQATKAHWMLGTPIFIMSRATTWLTHCIYHALGTALSLV